MAESKVTPGPLEDVQYWADRIGHCIALLDEAASPDGDDRAVRERLEILTDALRVQHECLVGAINFTSDQMQAVA